MGRTQNFPNSLELLTNPVLRGAAGWGLLEPRPAVRRRLGRRDANQPTDLRTAIMKGRAFVFSILISAAVLGAAAPAAARNCTRQGNDVTCDDGSRGVF